MWMLTAVVKDNLACQVDHYMRHAFRQLHAMLLARMPWLVALGQRPQSGMQSESDSDSNAAVSSLGNGSEHAVHEEDRPGSGKEDSAASHLPTEASHSRQVFILASHK